MLEPKRKLKPRGKPFAPGNQYRFKPGKIGGRPPGSQDKALKLSQAYGDMLEQQVEKGSLTRAEAIAQRMAHIATTGKPGAAVIAAKELADRTEGKAMQQVQVQQSIDEQTLLRLLDLAPLLHGPQAHINVKIEKSKPSPLLLSAEEVIDATTDAKD